MGSRDTVDREYPKPRVDYYSFIRSQRASTRLALRHVYRAGNPYVEVQQAQPFYTGCVVQIWSRPPLRLRVLETFVVHPVTTDPGFAWYAYQKMPPPLGLPLGPKHMSTVKSLGGAVAYGRGTPVHCLLGLGVGDLIPYKI